MTDGRTDPDRELAEAKVADAADARRQHRRQRELQLAETTMIGLLDGLADTGQTVVIVGDGGRRTTGVVVDVGRDVVLIETPAGLTVAVRTGSLLAVETPDLGVAGRLPVDAAPVDRTFEDIVAGLIGTGVVAALELATGVHLDGEVLGVGQDVVVVRAGGAQTIYVALDSMYELAWSASVG
jgi:hypothetical protein